MQNFASFEPECRARWKEWRAREHKDSADAPPKGIPDCKGKVAILITGLRGHGKTTTQKILVESLGPKSWEAKNMADPLKAGVATLFALSEAQVLTKAKLEVDPRYGVTPVHLLQQMGTDVLRDQLTTRFGIKLPLDMGLWTLHLLDDLSKTKATGVVVGDTRMPDEVSALVHAGAFVILIHISLVSKEIVDPASAGHVTEKLGPRVIQEATKLGVPILYLKSDPSRTRFVLKQSLYDFTDLVEELSSQLFHTHRSK